MKREMRRKDRAMEAGAAREVLARAEHGVLSTVGEDGTAYGVPLNHVLVGDSLYFHCAKVGHKLDNLRHQPEVSFCVVTVSEPVYRKDFTTRFESAIAFAGAVEVTEEEEMVMALRALCEKVLPAHMDKFEDLYKNPCVPRGYGG